MTIETRVRSNSSSSGGGGGGGGISYGGPVTTGHDNEVLYIDGSGNLASDSNFKWDTSATLLIVKSNSISNEPIIRLEDSFGNIRFEAQANGRITTDFMDWDITGAPYPVNFIFPMTVVESTVYGAGATSDTLFVHNISSASGGIVAYGLSVGVDATGYSNNIAISASANNADVQNIAIQANATTNVTGTNIGVYGNATNSGNIAYAIYGVAPLTTDNWAGYFDGTVKILHDTTFGGQLFLTRSTISESSGNQTWIGTRLGSHITVQGAPSDAASVAGNFYGLGGDAADASSTAGNVILDAGNPSGGTQGIIQIAPSNAEHVEIIKPLQLTSMTDLGAGQIDVLATHLSIDEDFFLYLDGQDGSPHNRALGYSSGATATLLIGPASSIWIYDNADLKVLGTPGFDQDGYLKNDVSGFVTGGHHVTEITGTYSQTNLTANPGPVTISGAGTHGLYRISYDMETVTLAALAVSAQLVISYTDRIGATSQSGTLLVLTASNRVHGVIELYLASGSIDFNVTVITISTAQFSLDVTCELLV